MRTEQKLKWLAGVLFLGVLGALPFQRTRPVRTRGQQAKSPAHLTVRRGPVVLSVPSAPQTRALESPASVPRKSSRHNAQIAMRESTPPPSFESSYRSLASRSGFGRRTWRILKDPANTLSGISPSRDIEADQVGDALEGAAAGSSSGRKEEEEPIVWRVHRLKDGDTLANLAQRYLKDARYAELLLKLNQDLITQPEILPLGVEIRIPPQDSVDLLVEKALTAAAVQRSKSGNANSNRMVPVPTATLKRIHPAISP